MLMSIVLFIVARSYLLVTLITLNYFMGETGGLRDYQ